METWKTRRMSGLTAAVALALLARAGTMSQALAAEETGVEGAIAGLTAQLEIERDILSKDRERYRSAAAARDAASTRLSALYSHIDAVAVAGGPESTPESLEVKGREIAAAEQAREAALARCGEALEQIRERLERILLVDRKIAALKGRRRPDEEPLTGAWEVTWLPSGDHGIFALKQTGSLLSGQYTLEPGKPAPGGPGRYAEQNQPGQPLGVPPLPPDTPSEGRKGSLQGTFTGGKIYLQRVDSRSGLSAEMEGYLDAGGRKIRGTWQKLNLTDGQLVSGSWTAVRRSE